MISCLSLLGCNFIEAMLIAFPLGCQWINGNCPSSLNIVVLLCEAIWLKKLLLQKITYIIGLVWETVYVNFVVFESCVGVTTIRGLVFSDIFQVPFIQLFSVMQRINYMYINCNQFSIFYGWLGYSYPQQTCSMFVAFVFLVKDYDLFFSTGRVYSVLQKRGWLSRKWTKWRMAHCCCCRTWDWCSSDASM